MINPDQLRTHIVDPVLKAIGLYTPVASALVMGTAAQESHLGSYIVQVKGPAKGIFQMEPATHSDIWQNFLKFKPELTKAAQDYAIGIADPEEMVGNLYYATAMCRVHYYRVKAALPSDPNDITGLAAYWKQFYNTSQGKGTTQQFIDNYKRFVTPGH